MDRDWSACLLCQSKSSTEKLRRPSNCPLLRNDERLLEACYRKVLAELHELRQTNKLPAHIRVDDLLSRSAPGDGSGDTDSTAHIVRIMKKNGVVSWHSDGRKVVNNQKVHRAQNTAKKRKNDETAIFNHSCKSTSSGWANGYNRRSLHLLRRDLYKRQTGFKPES